ncbi:MAG: hypothetical protein RDV48_30725 [Candidatus Eremiobacteraeota bacterium]|nr:hypothetical protein [Candidatus Eremiobacteraeota bacterium]
MKFPGTMVKVMVLLWALLFSRPSHAGEGKVVVFIRPGLFRQLSIELSVYKKDLRLEGYEVDIRAEDWHSSRQMKEVLLGEQNNNLKGCILIGDLPIPSLLRKGMDSRPCPLYLMDLDGPWALAENGTDIEKTPEWPQGGPEIWAGFIVPNLSTALAGRKKSHELIKEYFDKVHSYRRGVYKKRQGALSFVDDPWKANSTMGLEALYGENVTVINGKEDSTAPRLKKELAKAYEFVQIVSHNQGVDGIGVLNRGRCEVIKTGDFPQIKPRALFYNMGECSTCCYTTENYLGGWFLFGPCDGLEVFGSTMPGLINSISVIYQHLGKGESFGEAYKAMLLFEMPQDAKKTKRKWYLGSILLGDPMLTVRK